MQKYPPKMSSNNKKIDLFRVVCAIEKNPVADILVKP